VTTVFPEIFAYAWSTVIRMGGYLIAGIAVAAAVQSLVPQNKLRAWFVRAGAWPVVLATAAAVTTPLCSCSTVSLMIPLLAAGVPWGPIMAWLIASPMISPTGFVLVGGTLGWDMAFAKVAVAVFLGVAGGVLANYLQRRGWLDGQSRIPAAALQSGAFSEVAAGSAAEIGAGINTGMVRWLLFWRTFVKSLRQIVPIFTVFVFVAAAVRVLIPTDWVSTAFGGQQAWAIPAAAALGVPLYTSIASAVPLTASLLQLGMGRGAALALLLTGPGTSLPALAALFTVAKGRLIALYLVVLFGGSILSAWVFELVR
jgi:uncharacterized membrane protein YraQ (UPF0718 family)